MNLYEYVGEQIKRFRLNYGQGKGLSQEALAKALKVSSNTISRWETATYRPSLSDLEKLARFLGVSILEFFPSEQVENDEQITALLRTAKQLSEPDLDELRRYAEYRKARGLFGRRQTNPNKGISG